MKKLNILIPYRNRELHLVTFIPYINYYLKTNLDCNFQITIIEQNNKDLFNRGTLINIGYELEKNNSDYIAPHDVDLLPEDADYSISNVPIHLSAYRSQKKYILEYDTFFGGVNLFLNEHFEKINGFSNFYAGYGAEDDDLRVRCVLNGLTPIRRNCSYTSLYHKPVSGATPENSQLYYKIHQNNNNITMKYDGINSLKYTVDGKNEYKDYIHYFVNFKNERNDK